DSPLPLAPMAVAAGHPPRLPRVSYVFSSRVPAAPRPDFPRPEYGLFLSRHPEATLWDLTRAERNSRTGAALGRRGQAALGTAWATLHASPSADCFLATGEDIGLPLVLLARSLGDRRPIHILTHGSYFGSPKFRLLMRILRRDKNLYFLPLSGSLGAA